MMGAVGIVVSFIWLKVIYFFKDHPKISRSEMAYLGAGGALIEMDQPKKERRITEAEPELDKVEHAGGADS